MSRTVAPSSNRKRIFNFLTRSKRFHASCTAIWELDVTALLASVAAAKARGQDASTIAALVKATGLVLRAHPRLNHHLFHGLLGRYEVAFDQIHCATMVARRDADGEEVLFPAILRDADTQSVAEIDRTIRAYKEGPLEALPEYVALRKLKNLPGIVRTLFSFRSRASSKFYEKTFVGTYGLSSFAAKSVAPMRTTHALAPTAVAFFPGTIDLRPCVVDGEIVIRKVLPMSVVVDHFLLDGAEMIAPMNLLADLLAHPERLGLPASTAAGAEPTRVEPARRSA